MNKIPFIMSIIIALVILFNGLGEGTAEKIRYTAADMAAKEAARASLEDESWNLVATANAGTIILDESKAMQIAQNRFLSNQDVVGSVDVFIINNAPYTFSYLGQSHAFDSNGVAIVYSLDGRTFMRCAEVDDY